MQYGFYIIDDSSGKAPMWCDNFLQQLCKDEKKINLLMLVPSEGAYKKNELEHAQYMLNLQHADNNPFVLIVYDVHFIVDRVSHIWLKVLEELPNNIYVIFITPYVHMILPTVVSRAIVIKLDNENIQKVHPLVDACFDKHINAVHFDQLLSSFHVMLADMPDLLMQILFKLEQYDKDKNVIVIFDYITHITKACVLQSSVNTTWRALFILCQTIIR